MFVVLLTSFLSSGYTFSYWTHYENSASFQEFAYNTFYNDDANSRVNIQTKKVNDKTYQISPKVKKCVEFKEHNLLKDPYPTNCDLIVCRNVLIYFTEEAKEEIYKKFNNSLKKDGFLFVGSTEQIIQPQKLGYATQKSFFYKKI